MFSVTHLIICTLNVKKSRASASYVSSANHEEWSLHNQLRVFCIWISTLRILRGASKCGIVQN